MKQQVTPQLKNCGGGRGAGGLELLRCMHNSKVLEPTEVVMLAKMQQQGKEKYTSVQYKDPYLLFP